MSTNLEKDLKFGQLRQCSVVSCGLPVTQFQANKEGNVAIYAQLCSARGVIFCNYSGFWQDIFDTHFVSGIVLLM